ncbi:MAG: hypothetical protein Q8Q62_18625 [Mesorhizobium sp.]|nr:hypothetical protein [Mesorhizobium sp.]
MTQDEREFERQMTIAHERMDKHEVALSLLAQGENSPYWSEELKAEIEAAKVRLEKYRGSTRGR